MEQLDERLQAAVRQFWNTRDKQARNQGKASGLRDAGSRSAVTAGKHLDGFVQLARELLVDAGLPTANVHCQRGMELPGYFRPEKRWDLLAVVDGHLLAVIEFKAQVGPSFGNNFNNRAEEALGSATDLWAAYREGVFQPSQRPWLGFVFVLEDCPRSREPVRVKEPHFPIFPEFRDASYADRYEVLLTKLLRERLYDGASLLLTDRRNGRKGMAHSPSDELSFRTFATSLASHAMAFAAMRRE